MAPVITTPAAPVDPTQPVALDPALDLALAAAPDLRAVYQAIGGARVWTGPDTAPRRAALLTALSEAEHHGLPTARYALPDLSEATAAGAEVALMRAFLAYAGDIGSGALDPRKAARGIKRTSHRADPVALATALLAAPDAAVYFSALAPNTPEYHALLRARSVARANAARGGYGATVPDGPFLRPGGRDGRTPILRARLARLGYTPPPPDPAVDPMVYDEALARTLRAFQRDHGLSADGVIGPRTQRALNTTPARQMAMIDVALERERWLNIDRGARHIMVNLADFTVRLIDDNAVTFQTRAVVGATRRDKQTPEFSELMRYLEVNPDWTVPDGIIRRDYLPQLQEDPLALGHLELIDREGRPVDRETVDFTQYTSRTFPYMLRQPPGDTNALGRVKFMFPNPHAIYLHDTPEKEYFDRDVRTYSSGCVRLADPFDLAYVLLMPQMEDPVSRFDAALDGGRQVRISLAQPVPVHIDYRTAFVQDFARVQFRPDVYGRDGAVLEALIAADQPPNMPAAPISASPIADRALAQPVAGSALGLVPGGGGG